MTMIATTLTSPLFETAVVGNFLASFSGSGNAFALVMLSLFAGVACRFLKR